MNIHLDLDAVCGQFAEAAIDLHYKLGNCPKDYQPDTWDFFNDWNISTSDFWAPIDSSQRFWHELEPYDHFEQLIEVVQHFDPKFKILTSPRNAENCYAGKFYWVERHFGFKPNRRMHLYSNKHEFANSKSDILIDDCDSNIYSWVIAGGSAITFPQQWNLCRNVKNKVQHVKQRLSKLSESV